VNLEGEWLVLEDKGYEAINGLFREISFSSNLDVCKREGY